MQVVSSKTHYDHVKKTALDGHGLLSPYIRRRPISPFPAEREYGSGPFGNNSTVVLADWYQSTTDSAAHDFVKRARHEQNPSARGRFLCCFAMLDTFGNSFVRWKIV
jgi:hypothetical protein